MPDERLLLDDERDGLILLLLLLLDEREVLTLLRLLLDELDELMLLRELLRNVLDTFKLSLRDVLIVVRPVDAALRLLEELLPLDDTFDSLLGRLFVKRDDVLMSLRRADALKLLSSLMVMRLPRPLSNVFLVLRRSSLLLLAA